MSDLHDQFVAGTITASEWYTHLQQHIEHQKPRANIQTALTSLFNDGASFVAAIVVLQRVFEVTSDEAREAILRDGRWAEGIERSSSTARAFFEE